MEYQPVLKISKLKGPLFPVMMVSGGMTNISAKARGTTKNNLLKALSSKVE